MREISHAFAHLGWYKPVSQYHLYLEEQERGERDVLVAFVEGRFAGYVTVVWRTDYPPFRLKGIPEVQDLNVLPEFRRRRVATRLMDEAEELVARNSPVVGIGVGMTADYAAAQRMYARRGYIPDGKGLMSRGSPVVYGEPVPVDDDLVLYFTMDIGSNHPPF